MNPRPPLSKYAVRLRIDRRDIFFGDAIRKGTDWIVKTGGLNLTAPPPMAFEPLYSTWCGFHQNVCDKDVEAELAQAAKLGMKVVIVDDGWQTDDNNRGYAYTGDWEISRRRFPDMASQVKNVHALGMKYMVWYGVPMMGLKAKNHERFSGKYLWTSDDRWSGYSCMDPRFPEVREYTVSLYEKALREWDINGLKLDFIDDIGFRGVDPAIKGNYAGRDIRALPDAVDRLMKEICSRLKAIKPHRDALLKSGFRPHHYEAFYPWIEAWDEQERIVASYVSGMAVPVDVSKKVNFVLNGTGSESVIVDSASEAKAEICDTFGVQTGQMAVKKGLNKVKMSISGYLILR